MARPGNSDNLIPFEERTEEEQREIRSKGGRASGAARRRKRDSKAIAKMLLDLPTSDANKEALRQLGVDEEDFTNRTLLLTVALQKGVQGDLSAAKLLIELAGEDPKFKFEEKKYRDKMKHRSPEEDRIIKMAEELLEEIKSGF